MSDDPLESKNHHYSDEETARRRDDVIRRMANTPPKPHSQMKIGKRRAKVSQSGRPPKNEKGPATEPDPKS
jgi:hypothetical protein